MTSSKTILLIGRSGRGKSSLANVVTNTNNFKESSGSTSETKKIQSEKFKPEQEKLNKLLGKLDQQTNFTSEQNVVLDQEDKKSLQKALQEYIQNQAKYLIIDTPGIGDTKMSDNEVLDIIAEAVYLARDGIGQVFFVTDGRFDQYEMATYDLLRTIIFDENITRHTTIVRTRFPDFRDEEECQKDIDLMSKEFQEKKTELEENLKKEKKELTTTNLTEIIESCQGRVVHVDNPSLDAEDEEELKFNKEDRSESRKTLLEYLNKVRQAEPYKPQKLAKLSKAIAEDYFQYLQKKADLQKELEQERLKFQENQTTISQLSVIQNSDAPKKDNQTELIIEKEESLPENKEKLGVIEVKEAIAQLQDKKAQLEKEIQEKEKAVRQKVLQHIFNNYQVIKQELGGNVFLDSVTGSHNWPDIHSAFTEELAVRWLSQGFAYEQVKEWATALNDFDPKTDAEFCAWLRDEKQLTVDKIKRLSHPYRVEQLRKEYLKQLKGTVDILDEHNQQLSPEENWTALHPSFAKERYGGKTYQQEWEANGLTYLEAQEWIAGGLKPDDYGWVKQWKNLGSVEQYQAWIQAGFKPTNYEQVKGWKNLNFDPQQAKSWTEKGLKTSDYDLFLLVFT